MAHIRAKSVVNEGTPETMATAEKAETLRFQAEVGRLLDIVAHSLYSEKEIFLRELISNAADACDRLRYEALTKPELLDGEASFGIEISVDKDAGTITIADNGIGMSKNELTENLGTIARSGTSAFMDKLTGDASKDVSLIGQFGVGFYSGYMVADDVTVVSRRAGQKTAWSWESDGKGSFTVEPAARDMVGTTITLHLKKDATEYLEPARLRQIVGTYSNHIAFPITLAGAGEEEAQQLNAASAIWRRPKSEVKEDDYKEFYHHVSGQFDDPWDQLHFRVEGVIEYAGLLFIPSMRPFDLFHPDRKQHLKLYVKRVFITDDCEELVPSWLRFIRGMVDSEDLPLNISREMLQSNPVLAKIKSGVTKRVLTELTKKAEKDPEGYATFWENFGAVLKEGLYESVSEREKLLELCRFSSSRTDGLVSLADYVANMKEGQDAVYYITGEDIDAIKNSPQLEGFKAKGVEVLYMTDPVDDFWISAVGLYNEKPFKSVTRGGADLSAIKTDETKDETSEKDKAPDDAVSTLIGAFKTALGEAVKDVRMSDRLTDSAVCLVADENAMDMHLERMMRQHKQLDAVSARILEINPAHGLIKDLAARAQADATPPLLHDAAHLLLDQARILEGEPLPDPAGFARRMSQVMAQGISG